MVDRLKDIKKKILEITQRKLFINTVYSLGGKGIAMVLFMLADILCARLFTKDEYGEWNFFYAIATMFFWIVGFGISASTKVYAAKVRNDQQELNKYVNSGFLLRIIVTVIFIPILLLLGSVFAERLGYPDKYPNLKMLLFLGVFLVAFYTVNEFCKDTFIAMVKFKNMFWIAVAEYSGYLIWGTVGILLIGGTTGIAIGYILALMQCVAIDYWLLHRDGIRLGLNRFADKSNVSTIFNYALPILFISFGTLVLTEMDTVMLGIFSPPSEAGIYSIAKKTLSKITHINFAISSSVMTQFALITKENIEYKKRLYHRVVGMNLMLTMFISMVLLVAGPWGIKVLYGERYAQAGIVLRMLVPYYFMYGTGLFFSALLDYQEKANVRSVLYMMMVVLNLIFNYVLIPRFGAVGAAAATVMAMIPYYLGNMLESHLVFVRIKKCKDTQMKGK